MWSKSARGTRTGLIMALTTLALTVDIVTASSSRFNTYQGVVPPPWMLMSKRVGSNNRKGLNDNTVSGLVDAVRTTTAPLVHTATNAVPPAAAAAPAAVGLGAVAAAVGAGSSGKSKTSRRIAVTSPPPPSADSAPMTSTTRSTWKTSQNDTKDRALMHSVILSTALETIGLWGVLKTAQAISEHLALPVVSRVIWGDLPVIQWLAAGLIIFGSSLVQNVIQTTVQGIMTLLGGKTKHSQQQQRLSLSTILLPNSATAITNTASTKQVLRPNQVPSGSENWYKSLKKPWFNPPTWLFPIMWLLVCKPTQLYAISRILVLVPTPWWILAVYCLHLALGDAWNLVFFDQQRIGLGARVIAVFWMALVVTVAALFNGVEPTAGRFLLPTLAWVSVASALNFEIRRLNPSKP